jgi:hypothetical protein
MPSESSVASPPVFGFDWIQHGEGQDATTHHGHTVDRSVRGCRYSGDGERVDQVFPITEYSNFLRDDGTMSRMGLDLTASGDTISGLVPRH